MASRHQEEQERRRRELDAAVRRAAAASEPAAMPMAKNRLIAVSTSTPPPMRDLTMTGTSDSVIAPTIQNQLTAIAPTHCRSSALSSLEDLARRRPRVEVDLEARARRCRSAGMNSDAP